MLNRFFLRTFFSIKNETFLSLSLSLVCLAHLFFFWLFLSLLLLRHRSSVRVAAIYIFFFVLLRYLAMVFTSFPPLPSFRNRLGIIPSCDFACLKPSPREKFLIFPLLFFFSRILFLYIFLFRNKGKMFAGVLRLLCHRDGLIYAKWYSFLLFIIMYI